MTKKRTISPAPPRSKPTMPAPPPPPTPRHRKSKHEETRDHDHNQPHEMRERIEHLERHIHKLKKELEDMNMKFDEAIQKITTAADGVATRVAALEAGKGDLTPDQEAAANAVVTKLDGTATGNTP